MKKRIAIIFLFIYLMPALGVTVSWSKCNEAKMKANQIVKCICKPGKPNKKCCDSNKYTFKFKDSQQKADNIVQKLSIPDLNVVILHPQQLSFFSFLPSEQNQDFNLPRPPNLSKPDIYLLNRVFRI